MQALSGITKIRILLRSSHARAYSIPRGAGWGVRDHDRCKPWRAPWAGGQRSRHRVAARGVGHRRGSARRGSQDGGRPSPIDRRRQATGHRRRRDHPDETGRAGRHCHRNRCAGALSSTGRALGGWGSGQRGPLESPFARGPLPRSLSFQGPDKIGEYAARVCALERCPALGQFWVGAAAASGVPSHPHLSEDLVSKVLVLSGS